MAKSLNELKQQTINADQLFTDMRTFVRNNLNNPAVQNGIHQAQVEQAKGQYSNNNQKSLNDGKK